MIVAALFVPLFVFANAIDDGPFCKTERLGEQTQFPVKHEYNIRSEQCFAKVFTVPDPVCSTEDAKGVSVTACDMFREPAISLSNFLEFSEFELRHYANITRFNELGMCLEEANVTVTVYCGVPPGPYFLPSLFRT